jgi:hypothetical protein
MSDQLTFLLEAAPARISPSQDFERDWTESVVNSPSNSLTLLSAFAPAGFFGRTSPACCQAMEDGRLEPSSEGWGNSGMGSPTEFLTLSISEFPKDGAASSLSDILETGAVPQRYFLKAKACTGILRRAANRGKELPTILRLALEQVSEGLNGPEIPEDRTAVCPSPIPETSPTA